MSDWTRIHQRLWSAKRTIKAWLVDLLLLAAERLGYREDQFEITNCDFLNLPEDWWQTEVTPLGRTKTVIKIRGCLIVPKDVMRKAGIKWSDDRL